MTCLLTVHPGRNVWVLARTDLDGASKDDVLQTSANVMHHFLRPITPSGQTEVFEHLIRITPRDPAAEGRFIIGAARPVEIAAVQGPADGTVPRMRLPAECREHKLREQCDVLFTIAADRPWLVMAQFDWRGPLAQIPWPKRRVNLLGFAVDSEDENQWVLLEACWLGEAQELDTTLADDIAAEWSEDTRKALKKLADASKDVAVRIGQIAFFGVAAYLGIKALRSRRAKSRARLPA